MDNSGPKANSPGDADEWIAERHVSRGLTVRFRHVRPEDAPGISESLRTASRETLLHRFFSPIPKVSPDLLRKLLTIDRSQGACIVGVTFEHGKPRIICGSRYVRLARHDCAEIALTVHDTFQHRGLGRFMLKLLVPLATADGIRTFEADVMTSNIGMLKLIRSFKPESTVWQRSADVYHVTINIA